VGGAGKKLGLATSLCVDPGSYLRLFVFLGKVMSYGTAQFDKVYHLFFALLCHARGLDATEASRCAFNRFI
jgi:hypothetical protein